MAALCVFARLPEDDDDEEEEEEEEEEELPPPPVSGKKRPAPSPVAAAPAAGKKAKGAASTPVQSTPKAGGAGKEGVMGWTPKEEKALKAAVAKLGPETPNRWDKVAKEVGSKGKDACKKHAKELK